MTPRALPLALFLGASAAGIVLLAALPHLDAAEMRAGIVALALGSVVAAGMLLRALGTEASYIRSMIDTIDRISSGAIHVFVPVARDGAVGRLAESVNRLTDAARAGHLADESERALDRAMAREVPNGLLVTDALGRIRRTNPALAVLFPVSGEPVGKRAIETIPVPALQEAIDEAVRTREPAERTATVNGRDLEIRAFPLADGVGCLGVVADLTSVRRAERARRDFVSNVSHELRTPVTALIGYAEVLLGDKDELPASVVPMLEAIDRNARRLGALVEDVLSLSRIEARQGDLRLEPELLAPLIDEVLERFRGRATQKNIRLTRGAVPAVEALVNVEAFEHALGNLVDNALKYTPAEGHVTVRVEPGPVTINVSVIDDGVGIAEEHHERIFERFYRVDGGRARDVGGTGLGLALVKHLCLATGAEVVFHSRPGEGSTFTLKLPVAQAQGA